MALVTHLSFHSRVLGRLTIFTLPFPSFYYKALIPKFFEASDRSSDGWGNLQITRCTDNACEMLFVELEDNVVGPSPKE